MTLEADADAATLRSAFNRAATEYPSRYQMPRPVQEWWATLYAVIRDTEAGLQVLAQIARLEGEVQRLQTELTKLAQRRNRDSL